LQKKGLLGQIGEGLTSSPDAIAALGQQVIGIIQDSIDRPTVKVNGKEVDENGVVKEKKKKSIKGRDQVGIGAEDIPATKTPTPTSGSMSTDELNNMFNKKGSNVIPFPTQPMVEAPTTLNLPEKPAPVIPIKPADAAKPQAAKAQENTLELVAAIKKNTAAIEHYTATLRNRINSPHGKVGHA
jgi:hypothetical protein